MVIHCVAAEHGGLIKKKESSLVKLKAFPTNVMRPNYEHGIRKDNCLKKDTKITSVEEDRRSVGRQREYELKIWNGPG